MTDTTTCKPNHETGYVNLTIEIKDAPGIMAACKRAENAIKRMIEEDLESGRMAWAESKLAEKRRRQKIE